MSHKRLDKDNFLEQIVRYGYFAEQFPDCFSSDAFAAHLGVLSKTVAATKAEAGKSRKNTTTPTTLSMYKNGGYAGDDRMCDLVCDRYAVLQVMSRFGIAL